MRFELIVALRYLRASRLQTALIIAGVAVGILAFTFVAALINGLEVQLTADMIGNLAHVTLTPRDRPPRQLIEPPEARVLLAVQRGGEGRPRITGWRPLVDLIEETPGVTAVAPVVTGSGFVRRGEQTEPVTFTGTPRGKVSAIVHLEENLLRGSLELGPEEILIGAGLARELGISTGQRLTLSSERRRQRSLSVAGIFQVGSARLDDAATFVDLATAQSLMDLDGAVSRIDLKVAALHRAPVLARDLAGATGLEGSDWIAENERLKEALRAQRSSGNLIKAFSLATIVIGVASALLLSALRRRPEIGILRSFGVSRRSVSAIFLLQGLLLGLLGSLLGAAGGWLFCRILLAATLRPDGTAALPVDPARGEYVAAVALATLAGTLAAILPARQAQRTDPVEVIQQ